jgi:hypothetical protein
MKRLLLILILTFSIQSLTKADDIKDFQIEGMSIGDSALKYFSEDEIISNIRKNSYKGSDGLFFDAQFEDNDYEVYEQVSLVFKKYDKKYIIYSLGGLIFYDNNKQKCIDDHKKIGKDVEKLFPNHIKDILNDKHSNDPADKRSIYGMTFLDKTYSGAEVSCYTWSNEEKYDYVIVAIDTSEFGQWLQNYYNN